MVTVLLTIIVYEELHIWSRWEFFWKILG